MLLENKEFFDSTSKTTYNLQDSIPFNSGNIVLLKGKNGIGKSRFIEGVLLKELKQQNLKTLYFAQDIENQLLSFKLISLVKEFIMNLKKQNSFFKTIFLNDDSHNNIKLDFDQDEILEPSNSTIHNFILKETQQQSDLDIIIFDEVDKYFSAPDDFIKFIGSLEVKNIFVISHIFNGSKAVCNSLIFTKSDKGVNIEFLSS